jgi:hypothetical protein
VNTTVQSLAVRISSERAALFFERPRLFNLYGLLARPTRVAKRADPDSRILPFLECLWMAAYAALVRTTVRRAESTIWTSVDGWSGDVTLFDAVVELTPCEKTVDFLAPALDETRAAEAARAGLQKYILRRRGQINKPVIEGVDQILLYYYPVWVYYYRRRRRHIDIKVLDAVTAKPAGAKVRVGVLNALVASRREAESKPGQ